MRGGGGTVQECLPIACDGSPHLCQHSYTRCGVRGVVKVEPPHPTFVRGLPLRSRPDGKSHFSERPLFRQRLFGTLAMHAALT